MYFLTARFMLNTMVIFIFMYNNFYESKRDFHNPMCPKIAARTAAGPDVGLVDLSVIH